jgi:hypothetical protein
MQEEHLICYAVSVHFDLSKMTDRDDLDKLAVFVMAVELVANFQFRFT